MPPRGRRKRPSENSRPRQSAASSLAQTEEPSGLSLESNAELPPFFNTTFSTHRVSPLYIGAEALNRERLSTLSKTLRDLLVGDVVRGVEVGLDGEDSVMARAGALEAIDMGWETVGSILGLDPDTLDDIGERPVSRDLSSDGPEIPSSASGATERRLKAASTRQALHISLRYESARCTALLLPRFDGDEDDEADLEDDLTVNQDEYSLFNSVKNTQPAKARHFRALPLLLLRMPTPLKPVIIDFLSNTFDCRVSPVRLGTKTLVSNLERWIKVADRLNSASASKDVVLTLGFSIPPVTSTETDGSQTTTTVDLGLKSVDVIISAPDLQDFRERGLKPLKRKGAWEDDGRKRGKVDGHLLEEGWEWRDRDDGSKVPQPFTEALGAYFDEHLALNLFDSRTRIIKVACGGFVMSEGRLKLFPPLGDDGERRASTEHMRAVVDCLGDLLDKAMVRL
jgi:hypothetical protein